MMNKKQEVQDRLQRLLAACADPVFCGEGFSRKTSSSCYTRRLQDSLQEVHFVLDLRPSVNAKAVADLLPQLSICFPEVNRVAVEMVGGDVSMLANAPEITIRQQFHVSGPGARSTYWYLYGDERDKDCIREVCSFAEAWVLPVLDEYTDIGALLRAYESNDERILKQRHFYLFVAAAYVTLGHPKKAAGVLDKKFGRPGARRTHAMAFAYVDELLSD